MYLSYRYIIILIIQGVVFYSTSRAQSVNAPFNQDYYALIEHYEIRSGKLSSDLGAVVKPFTRRSVAAFAAHCLADSSLTRTRRDLFNLSYLQSDQWEWVHDSIGKSKHIFAGNLYQKKSDFFYVKDSVFDLHINPVLYLGLGREQGQTLYINSRGIDIRGMLHHKLGFYTFFTENQAVLPSYVSDNWIQQVGVVPYEGFWKSFGTRGVDFFTAKGYLSYNPLPSINIQTGYDRFFVGNGYRSLILSDFAPNYLFLKIHTQIWKIQYTNVFAQMQADIFGNQGGTFGGKAFPKKYMAFHQLSMRITPRLNLGLFETIIFNRDTVNNYFDINYLNPIIFYRSVEQQLGSPDNAVIGMNFRGILWKHFSVYGQFVLDEFLLKEVRAGNGWWSNKYAMQLGVKYIDAFHVPQLDMQAELNLIRPYTYAHESGYTNMSHYRQPLAHPLGANLNEFIFILRYQICPTLSFTGKYVYITQGLDEAGLNWGGNILLDYRSHVQDYGNHIGQGLKVTTNYVDATMTYMMKHNLFVDFKLIYRKQDSDSSLYSQRTSIFVLALRCNIGQRLFEF